MTKKYFDHPAYVGLASNMDSDDNRHPQWEKEFNTIGFDDTSMWNLDTTLITFIYPRLVEYKRITDEIHEKTELTQQLDVVIEKFKNLINDLDNMSNSEEKIEAFRLLSEIIPGLWY